VHAKGKAALCTFVDAAACAGLSLVFAALAVLDAADLASAGARVVVDEGRRVALGFAWPRTIVHAAAALIVQSVTFV
jgi:hypothetical protein